MLQQSVTLTCLYLICPVLQHLQCLCKVVLHFDTTLLIHTWKNTCKLLHKHRVVLSGSTCTSESLQLQDFVDELCSTVESTYLKCIQTSSGAVQDFQRLVKACKQLLGYLITLLRVSSCEGPHGSRITRLTNSLYLIRILMMGQEIPGHVTSCS